MSSQIIPELSELDPPGFPSCNGEIGPEEFNVRKITHASIKMTTNPTPPESSSALVSVSGSFINQPELNASVPVTKEAIKNLPNQNDHRSSNCAGSSCDETLCIARCICCIQSQFN